MNRQYETVIGLEVHVELATKTKIFCGCSTAFGGEPNIHTCPVCTGMPGALPVLNKKVVEYAIAVGLATNCSITRYCKFDRKNYFYPDNPQNYQISQMYLPICCGGSLQLETENGKTSIGIHEIHMEEDAGKLIHDEKMSCTSIDYNRSGVPLIEIVTEPDFRTPQEVLGFLDKLRTMLQYLGVSDCKLQEGSMRVDVNLSVRLVGEEAYGVRTEMKNLNSFKAITRAIEAEKMRQITLLEAGKAVVQETRRWDDSEGCSYSMRSKEDARDYRYFPEPDLVPVVISEKWLEEIKQKQPELREEKIQRYKKEYNLPEYDVKLLTSVKPLADMFEAVTALCGMPKKVSNWLMVEVMRLQKEHNMEPEELPFSPENLAKLIQLAEEGAINGTVAKKVFEEVFLQNVNPEEYVEIHGLKMVNDEEEICKCINNVLKEYPKSVEDYHNGKERALGFLMGQTMKAMGGKANPGMVTRLLKELL